jgi:phenylacetate-CoA ligase
MLGGSAPDILAGTALAHAGAAVIAARQDELLRRHLHYCAAHSPFYRRRFARLGIAAEELQGVADLAGLPFTDKSDLENCHADFCAVPPTGIVDLCLTSGTTGKSVAMLQSAADLRRLADNEELAFGGVGFTAADRVLVAVAIDRCFMAGLAYFLGLTRIGATVIRGGSSSAALLVELIKNCRPSAIVGVPTLLLAVGERLRAEGLDPARLGVTRLVGIGEPIRNQDFTLSPLGARLAQVWCCQLFGTYSSTEMATSFTDCTAGRGGHLLPEVIVVEIVDEEGGAVPPGSLGEVVATPLGVTGMPLLRFRTGDIAALHHEPCPCGRQTPRLGPLVGRKSQMLKIRGTTVYPPAIASVLQGLPAVQGYYLEAQSEFALSDRLRVVIGASDSSLTPAYVADQIAAAIRVRPEVEIVSPAEILKVTVQDNKRKPVTFFDLRTR